MRLGQQRWPMGAREVPTARVEVAPLRLGTPRGWQDELWARSLRQKGVALQEAVFAEGTRGAKALHEEGKGH